MKNINIFEGIDEKEINKILKNLDTETINISKNDIIMDNNSYHNTIGIILNGEANIEKYDYNGNRVIIEKLKKISLFGDIFSNFEGEIEIIAKVDCEVLLIDYDNLINKNKNRIFINNLFQLLVNKNKKLNTRLDILSKRTIRDKLVSYISSISNKSRRYITLPFTYTDLADYLCVDRSAMMRELKKMKNDGIIKTDGKKIKLLS